MRWINVTRTAVVVIVLSLFLAAVSSSSSQADAASGPSLVISQVKITSGDGQFVMLYNTTGQTLDMSKYQVEYFNNYDLRQATSSKLIVLSGSLPSHSYYMLNDDALQLCYQVTVDSVSLGFSSTAGLVEVLGFDQAAVGTPTAPQLQDYAGWSKTAAAGAQTLPSAAGAFLQRQPVDSQNNPAIGAPGDGSWLAVQPDPTHDCGLIAVDNPSQPVQIGFNGQLLPATEPPATVVSIGGGSGALAPTVPAADLGLKAPSVTELLPNPEGIGNDDTDEFIELYNSNVKNFDLSSFILQTGTTKLHNFTIPPGTSLPARGFLALYSSKTKLSMSNAGGQARLLDPLGRSVSVSAVYATAKDGQAWALAKGKWYWTNTPTPGKANIIKQPTTAKKSSKKAAASKSTTAKNPTSLSASDQPGGLASSPVHLAVLAIVGGLALLYGAYEYRADLANHVHQFRRNIAARRRRRA